MQEITLAGLNRSGFFEKAAFYGGTALRIFYGLDRFSEDLDFSLLAPDPSFSLELYFDAIITEFASLGITVSIKEKQKVVESNVESAFLKSDTVWKELILEGIMPQARVKLMPHMKIKIEVDTEPPLGFENGGKTIDPPVFVLRENLHAAKFVRGKKHALLFRKWKNRVKGRDWYDLEWYIKKGIPLDLEHFLLRAQDTGDWKDEKITAEQFLKLLTQKISNVDFGRIKDDVVRFIPDDAALKIWGPEYFQDLTEKLKFQDKV
ncbi:nucleotidyl transferase AbiEii/AbiGii toxin family protein [Mucilaginibacter sp. UC70_90]